jgi:hypothetical protein
MSEPFCGVESKWSSTTFSFDPCGVADVVVTVPTYRDPRTEKWKPAFDLPVELWMAISLEVAEAVTGKQVEKVA